MVCLVISSYKAKYIQSGNVLERYEYEKPIIEGYVEYKKASKGRQSVASDKDSEVNRKKVCDRARRDLRRIVNSNIMPYSKFLTLTFKDNVQDIKLCNREFSKFIQRLNYYLKFKVQYSGVIEFQKRGAIHYHVIIYNIKDKIDLKKLKDIWGYGFVKLNKIDNCDNVGAYVCKYMTKTDDERLRGQKMYFNSRGLKKPIEIKESALVLALDKSLQGSTPTFESEFDSDYNSVVYKQYKI